MSQRVRLQKTGSTNRVARDHAESGAEHGTVVVATRQENGRGRLGKTWFSPGDTGLYCTVILRPVIKIEEFSQITLAAGVAVAEAIESMGDFTVQLKWPNDIFLGGRKCGGILVEASPLGDETRPPYALVGIGINVNTPHDSFPEELKGSATSLLEQGNGRVSIDEVCTRIQQKLLETINEFEKDGFAPILGRWRTRDMLAGKWLHWVSHAREVVYGKSLGVDETGMLNVEDEEKKIHLILSGDIRMAEQQ